MILKIPEEKLQLKKMNKNLAKSVRIIKSGGIVIFPTDTAFGIGCRIDDKKSIRKLFTLRKRSPEKAVPVLVSSIKMAEEYVEKIDPTVRRLMKKYWPGGLTIILKCKKDKVPGLVRGGGTTIGLRIPGSSTTRKLIRDVGVPVLAPSANFSGGVTPFKFSTLAPELVSLVDFVLPGRCSVKKASTVVDCSEKSFKILRQGAVRVE